jgi:hypothetical protein
MLTGVRIRGFGLEQLGGRQIVTIQLNAVPSARWIDYFKDRAQASVIGLTSARFWRNRIYVELPRRDDLEVVRHSVEAIIEGVNLDVQFKTELPRRYGAARRA